MNVYGKDITQVAGQGIKDFSEMDKIVPMLDVITLHLPSNAQTKGLFNKEMFGYMKPGAFLINTARADLIDEDAMIEAINTKNIHVALDVFKGEPEAKDGKVESRLQALKNVYVTHHIGASTEQAQNAVAEETVNIIRDFINSGVIAHWVNKAKVTDAKFQLVVKHYDKPGVLSSILSIIKEEDINIEDVENIIFDGGVIACCTMKLKSGLSADRLKRIQENPSVLSMSHVQI